jgi:hypothetical protein
VASKVVWAYIGLGFSDLVLEEVVVSSADQITPNQLTSHALRVAVKELRDQRPPLWIDLHV